MGDLQLPFAGLFTAFHSSSARVLRRLSPSGFGVTQCLCHLFPLPLLCSHTQYGTLQLASYCHCCCCHRCGTLLSMAVFAVGLLLCFLCPCGACLLSLLSSRHGAETSKKRRFRRVFQSGFMLYIAPGNNTGRDLSESELNHQKRG